MCIIICSSRPISREMSVLMLAIMQENSTAFRTKDSVSLFILYILSVIDKVIKEVCLTNEFGYVWEGREQAQLSSGNGFGYPGSKQSKPALSFA